jgi:glycosyltransferase involved in cell wall biosynthesis
MKIGVIGTAGEGKATSSGQEIRTKILLDALCKNYGEANIYLMDTGLVKKSKVRAAFSLVKCLLECKDIILIVSRNGLRLFLPILSFSQKYLGKHVYNNIIGGNILELIAENPKYIKYMKTFIVNWVQMESLSKGLAELGINNSEVLPNSKPIQGRFEVTQYSDSDVKRYCTFSRISKAKGIELAINAIDELNKSAGKTIATLDIYGIPDDDYKDEFERVIEKTESYISYKGLVPFDKSPEVLCEYYMLLFPTTFYGEGFPGTILDAYAAGLPVLASDWKFNPELITDGVTGYLYDHTSYEDFKKKLEYTISHKEEICNLRENCYKELEKYEPENVMPIIFNKLNKQRG